MLELINLNKVYVNSNNVKVHALKDVNLKLSNKGFTFIVGPSGGGKSTLLNIIGGLDDFDGGQMLIKGVDSKQLNAKAFDSYRNTYVGFIFQEFNLLDHLTLAENVALAVELKSQKPSRVAITEVFNKLGLTGMEDRYPNEISGGQRQRVAIARVLIKKPAILFADEAAGSVDKDSRKYIYDMLKELSKDILVVAVTHNAEIPEIYADRILTIDDGRITGDRVIGEDRTNADVFGKGEVVMVEAGKTLNPNDIDEINKYLTSKNSKGMYICLEDKLKSVETLHPKVVEEIKKAETNKKLANKEDAAAKKEAELKAAEENQEPFQLIKAKLPAKAAFKMARTQFGSNKFRTIFTVVLSILAISFFALSSILTGFNGNSANIGTFKNGNNPYMTLSTGKMLDKDDVGSIKAINGGNIDNASLISTFGEGIQIGSNEIKLNKFIRLNGEEVDQTIFGQKLVKGDVNSTWPQAKSTTEDENTGNLEIVISDWAAEKLIEAKVGGVTEVKDIIGKMLGDYKIVGIYQTNYAAYKNSKEEAIQKQLNYLEQTTYNTILVRDDFNQKTSIGNANFETNIQFGTATSPNKFEKGGTAKITVVGKTDLAGAIIPDSLWGQVKGDEITLQVSHKNGEIYKHTFKGVTKNPVTDDITLTLPKGTTERGFENIVEALVNPSLEIAVGHQFTEKQFNKILASFDNSIFSSVNSNEINEFAHRFDVVGDGFLVTSIILAMFAILLLYSFVTTSIRSKRKNIGILRAIGAGMKDIFKIFMLEALMLTACIVLGSFVVTVIATIIANAVVQAGVLYGLTVFAFNWITFLCMFGISVVATFASYTIPLLSLTRIKPIEIMTRKQYN